MAVLSSDEQRYLEAQMAYNAGKPIMSDVRLWVTSPNGNQHKLALNISSVTSSDREQ